MFVKVGHYWEENHNGHLSLHFSFWRESDTSFNVAYISTVDHDGTDNSV